MQLIRVSVPHGDVRELAAGYGANITAGGLFLATRQLAKPGAAVGFELCARDGAVIFSGEGVVAESGKPVAGAHPGLQIRYTRLSGKERSTLDRLLLFKAGAGAGLPVAIDASHLSGSTPLPRAVMAIDIGGTLARAAVASNQRPQLVSLGPQGATAIPAAVVLDSKNRFLIGNRARAQRASDPASGVPSPLPLMTLDPRSQRDSAELSRLPFPVVEDIDGPSAHLPLRSVKAAELYSSVARELRSKAQDAAGQPLGEAWATVSPTYDARVRNLIEYGLKLAGFAATKLIEDSLAVAAFYGFTDASPPAGPLVVVDWGGTTCSVSVVELDDEDHLRVIASGLKRSLGGATVDERIARTLIDQLEADAGGPVTDPLARQRVLDAAESARVALSSQPEVRVRIPWVTTSAKGEPVDLDATLSSTQMLKTLDAALDQLMRVTFAVLEEAGVAKDQVDRVLLAGGQCSWPKVAERFSARFPEKVTCATSPGTCTVLGAAMLAHQDQREAGGAQAELTEGLSVLGAGGTLIPLLPPGTPLPANAALRLKPERGVGLFCALSEGATLGEDRYLGSLVLSSAKGEVGLSAAVDERGVIELKLESETGDVVQTRMALLGAEPATEASVYADLPLPFPAPRRTHS